MSKRDSVRGTSVTIYGLTPYGWSIYLTPVWLVKPVLGGLTLIHEALRGCDIKTPEGHANFITKLKQLYAQHGDDVEGIVVTENGAVVELK